MHTIKMFILKVETKEGGDPEPNYWSRKYHGAKSTHD